MSIIFGFIRNVSFVTFGQGPKGGVERNMSRRQKLFRMIIAFFSFVWNDLRFRFVGSRCAQCDTLLGSLKKGVQHTKCALSPLATCLPTYSSPGQPPFLPSCPTSPPQYFLLYFYIWRKAKMEPQQYYGIQGIHALYMARQVLGLGQVVCFLPA